MTNDPDVIRRQIEGTRRELSEDVNALTEKVTPSRVVARRVDRARDTMTNLKDRIMGSADSATSTMSDTAGSAAHGMGSAASGAAERVSSAASSAADAVSSAPQAVRRRTEGNPLAAGLIAFGLGWLISSLLPATRKEQQLAAQARDAVADRMEPVTERLQEAASEMKENLRQPAQQAVESVKATASGAAATVADESRVAAGHVTSRTEDARENLKNGIRT